MFGQIAGIRDEVAALAAGFDPDALDDASVVPMWEQLDQIARAVTSMTVRLARRVDDTQQWKRLGYASAAEYLAAMSGSSVAAARDVLATSTKLRELPVVEDAMRTGQLSAPQVVAIADAAALAPAEQSRLVNDAQRTSLSELRQACLRTKAAAAADREATRQRIHRERYLRAFTDPEGARNLHVRGPVDQVARIEARLRPFIDEEFENARVEGRHEERDAYAFSALVRLADAATDGNVTRASKQPTMRNLMLLRVDLQALTRGHTEDDELCEITGLGPISVAAAREVLGESILKLVITKGVDVLHVTHLGRSPTEAQKVALLFQQPLCAVEGCYRTRCENDHRLDWADTRHTVIDELEPLCHHDHLKKTLYGWALVEGSGKRPFVPPDDPRHPNNKPPPAPPA